MDKNQIISKAGIILGQLAIVVAGVLAADMLKNHLAKSKITKPLEVKQE